MQVGAENLLAFEEATVKRVPLVTTLLQWAKLIPVYSLTAVFRSLSIFNMDLQYKHCCQELF